MKFLALLVLLAPPIAAGAETLIPMAEGTTWDYELVQEKPSSALDLTEPNERTHFNVSYRLGGSENIDNKDLRRLEIYRGDELESVDLIAIEEHGIVCPARTDPRGAVTKLIPPQTMIAAPVKAGTRWKFEGTIGDTKVSQNYEITGEEEIEVPAGKFRAWRIHCEQTLPSTATIDRWFVPGTGFVRVASVIKGDSGVVAQKTWMNLKGLPKITASKNSAQSSDRLSAEVSNDPQGEAKTEFKVDSAAIYARWHGRGLPKTANIRAVFIADNVTDVTADYQIDEIETTAAAPNSGGTFELSRPEGGWADGDYRVEFFVNEEAAQTIKFKITK
jgi:hypothetical protein